MINVTRKTCIIISGLILILLGLMFLWYPYSKMSPLALDYGLLLNVKLQRFKDIIDIFSSTLGHWQHPDDIVAVYDTNLRYRPFAFFLLGIEKLIHTCLFQQSTFYPLTHYYFFFFFHILFHCFNVALFFYISTWFFSIPYAFVGSVFFLFHASLVPWFAWLSSKNDIVPVFFLLLMSIFLKSFLQKPSKTKFFFYSISYFCAVFSREAVGVIPLLVFCFIFLYLDSIPYTKKIINALKITAPLIFINGLYGVVLISFFAVPKKSSHIRVHFWKERLWSLIIGFKDLTGCAFIKTPNPYKVMLYMLPIVIFLCICLMKAPRRKFLIFLAGSFLFMAWPIFFVAYDKKYLYPALPFFILYVMFSLKPLYQLNKSTQSILFLGMVSISLSGNLILTTYLKNNEILSYTLLRSTQKFAELLTHFSHKEIILMAFPGECPAPLSQVLNFFMLNNNVIKINAEKSIDRGIFLNWSEPNPEPIRGALIIKQTLTGCEFTLQNSNIDIKSWPQETVGATKKSILGPYLVYKTIQKKINPWRATQVSLTFNKTQVSSVQPSSFLFFMWHPFHQQFIPLPCPAL